MSSFMYEFWTVVIEFETGSMMCEYCGKNRENVVRQIEKEVKQTNSEKNLSLPWIERKQRIVGVRWDTLTLDRTGYRRRF